MPRCHSCVPMRVALAPAAGASKRSRLNSSNSINSTKDRPRAIGDVGAAPWGPSCSLMAYSW